MVGGVRGDSHEFGLRPADLHPHKFASSWSITRTSCMEHARRWGNYGDVIGVTEWAGIHLAGSWGYNDAAGDVWGGRLYSWKGPVQWHSLVSRQSRWRTLLTERKRCAPLCGCLCWRKRTESSSGTPQIWRTFLKGSRNTESNAALKPMKAM